MSLSQRLLRVGTWILLLPVSVAAAAPQVPTVSHQPGADALLTRTALLQGAAAQSEPVASVTVVASNEWAVSTTPLEMAERGIPRPALNAYRDAEATMRVADPGCRLTWSLLAGIGGVESDHGREAAPALGPMQFVPSAWQIVGVDGDGDGKRDPQDVDDAALAAAAYLCVGARDLGTSRGVRAAVFSYNHSQRYVALVTDVAAAYQRRIVDLPPLTGAAQMPTGPGVAVGVGDPGGGMLIGASDDVADDADADRADREHADRRATDGEDAEQPATRRDRSDRRKESAPRTEQTDRADDKPAPERTERRAPKRDGGDRTTPPTHEPKKDSKQPTDKPSRKPKQPAGGKGSGGDEADEQPTAKKLTGKVVVCEDDISYCLKGQVLAGPFSFADYVEQTITVLAVVDGGTLHVQQIQ